MPVLYPPAKWLETGTEKQQANDPHLDVVFGAILHVAGSKTRSLKNWFDQSGGIESQLFIGDEDSKAIEQYRSLDQEADANYLGNSWLLPDGRRAGFHSVETSGGADGEWDPWTLNEIKKFLLWDSQRFGYPLRVAPGYRSPGVGYHVMFGTGRDNLGWSNASGKVCPGPDRIRQFTTVLVPWMAEVTNPAPKEWDEMATKQEFESALHTALKPLTEQVTELRTWVTKMSSAESQREQFRVGEVQKAVGQVKGLVYEVLRTQGLSEGDVERIGAKVEAELDEQAVQLAEAAASAERGA